jgi:type IV pilus assembly protein PilM
MARLPSHPEKIITSLLPAQTSLRMIRLPVRQIKKAEKMFRFELEDSTPFKLEDTILEHQTYRTKEGCGVFTAIALKRLIQTHIDWLKSIDLEPDWLTFDGMGAINTFLSSPPEADAAPALPILLIDIGHQKTNLAIFEESRISYFRSLPWGGFQITQAIASTLEIPLEEAEQVKHTRLRLNSQIENAPDSKALYIAASDSLSALIADITHTLHAFRAQSKKEVETAYLCGGTSKTNSIANFMSNQLGFPVTLYTPEIAIRQKEITPPSETVQFAEALGRALAYGRKVALLFNFRKGELAKATSLNEVGNIFENPAIRKMVAYGGVLIAALFLHASVAKFIASRHARISTDELRKAINETFASLPAKQKTALSSSPAELQRYIENKSKELDDRLKMAGKTEPSMLTLVKALSNSFPPDLKVDVNTLVIDDKSLVIEGVLYQDSLERATETLKKISYFSNVGLTMNGQRFTYRGAIKGR